MTKCSRTEKLIRVPGSIELHLDKRRHDNCYELLRTRMKPDSDPRKKL